MRTADEAYKQTIDFLKGSMCFVLDRLDAEIEKKTKEGLFSYEMKLGTDTISTQHTTMLRLFLHEMETLNYKVESSQEGHAYIISWAKT